MATKKQPKPKLTHQRLLELLAYDPQTGVFRWRIQKRRADAGSIAGAISKHGYRVIGIDRKLYRAARLAWFYVHGHWPSYELDHKDLIRDHDWIDNLRPAEQTQNNANRRAYRNNKSGLKGVYMSAGRWRAGIRIDGKSYYIGTYDTAEAAHAAYVAKAKELFGEFANSG